MVVLGIFWLLFVVAAIMPLRWSVTLLFASLPFGSLTVVPGSTTILPYVALSPLVVAKVLLTNRNINLLWDGLLNWRRLGLLTVFMAVAMFVTYTAPALFHDAKVMGLNTSQITNLGFGSGNVTQPLYLTMSFLLCVALYVLMLSPSGLPTLAIALLTGATIAVFSGLIDMATAGTTLLAPLRTASYAILNGAEVANYRRVIGFNTEASSFGALTLSFATILIFMSPASWLGSGARVLERGLSIALLVLAVLSTSSSAYLGLVLFGVMYALRLAALIFVPRSNLDRRRSAASLLVLVMAGLIGCSYVIAKPSVLNGAISVVNNTLVEKSGSDSADERSSWNRVSLQGFAATGGYGVGVGSTRTSSWIVAVLSSTGVLGALMLLAFLLRCFLAYLPRTDAAIRFAAVGARYAFLITLVPAAVAGTLVDFGTFNAFLFAMMAAAPKLLSGRRLPAATRVYPFRGPRPLTLGPQGMAMEDQP